MSKTTWLTLALVLASCGEPVGPSEISLTGAVHKGPFVTGSGVLVSVLSPALAPTGRVFSTATTNDVGEFAVTLTEAAPVLIEGDGFYYNEATGELSTSRIVLRALYVPSTAAVQSAHVNMITHLTTERIRALVRDGAAFDDAVEQAEDELRAALAITPPSFDPSTRGTAMTLTGGDTDANAYAFGVSSVLVSVAASREGSTPDAHLQEILNVATLDLADGTLSSALRDEIAAALLALDTRSIERRFAARLAAVGSSSVVPDLDRVLDQDGDGLANADDNCDVDVNAGQEDGEGDGWGDACDDCPATACAADCIPAVAPYRDSDVCVTLCAPEGSACDTGERCATVLARRSETWLEGFDVCAPECDPFDGSSCPSGTACVWAEAHDPVSIRAYLWFCAPVYEGGLALGAHCTNDTAIGESCAPGSFCNPGSFTCDEYCDLESATSCDSGVICEPRSPPWDGTPTPSPGHCAATLTAGSTCDPHAADRCPSGYACHPQSDATCMPVSTEGGACSESQPCDRTLRCTGEGTPSGEGICVAECTFDWSDLTGGCAAGQYCRRGDVEAGFTYCAPAPAAGEPCPTDVTVCGTGLACSDGTCVTAPALGEACSSGDSAGAGCAIEHVCSSGVCQALPTRGAACIEGRCASGLHCDATTSTCGDP